MLQEEERAIGEPTYGFEIDENNEGVIVFGCPECGETSRHKLRGLNEGDTIACPKCGQEVKVRSDGNLPDLQDALDRVGDLAKGLDIKLKF